MIIRGRISVKESQGIFDYENTDILGDETFIVNRNTRVALNQYEDSKKLEIVKDGKGDPDSNEIVIFRLKKDKVLIIPNKSNFNMGGFWVRVLQEEDVSLSTLIDSK